MPDVVLIFFFLAVGGGVSYAIYTNRKPKRMSDERLAYYRSYLTKPVKKNGDKQNGDALKRPYKPFKTTTAQLPEGAEAAIKEIFTPQMLAEFEEGYTALLHRLALRAINLEQVLRKQAMLLPGQKLTADDEAVLVSEGLREAAIDAQPETAIELPAEPTEPEVLDICFKPRDEQINPPSPANLPYDQKRALYE